MAGRTVWSESFLQTVTADPTSSDPSTDSKTQSVLFSSFELAAYSGRCPLAACTAAHWSVK